MSGVTGRLNPDLCPRPDKVPYFTRDQAKYRLRKERRTKSKQLRVYLCACGMFHIGRIPLRKLNGLSEP